MMMTNMQSSTFQVDRGPRSTNLSYQPHSFRMNANLCMQTAINNDAMIWFPHKWFGNVCKKYVFYNLISQLHNFMNECNSQMTTAQVVLLTSCQQGIMHDATICKYCEVTKSITNHTSKCSSTFEDKDECLPLLYPYITKKIG